VIDEGFHRNIIIFFLRIEVYCFYCLFLVKGLFWKLFFESDLVGKV
jgi:hypothetical protein